MRSSKKNLEEQIKSDASKLLFFFDESRFGTHSKAGCGWFKTGVRTPVLQKLGFQNFYLYSAVSPKSGEDFSLILDGVDTCCMNIYLQQMSLWLGDKKAFVVMDQAGWHKAKDLVVPSNIFILYLPPYSPELNPVERFWQYMKNALLKNRIYDSLKELEDVVCDFICSMQSETIKTVCHVNYMSYYL